jgi:predicted RNA-binding Zn-ribbon protein involved in translation (DUF1610 family)
MQTVASLSTDEAQELVERLKAEAVAAELQIVPHESGVELGEVLVNDADFDRACDLAEAWQAQRLDEAERRANVICPKCHSYHVERVPHPKLEYVERCRDCGFELPR